MAIAINTRVNITQPGYFMGDQEHRVVALITTNPETGENSPTPEGEEPDIYEVRRLSNDVVMSLMTGFVEGTLVNGLVSQRNFEQPEGIAAEYVEVYTE